mmetsp:Transcript_56121/g.121427  ORF Transcript_56121/g.121427 Transcript_56121/m.121427 type:complete len:814 (-) Transcript_56121:358-2799(-)
MELPDDVEQLEAILQDVTAELNKEMDEGKRLRQQKFQARKKARAQNSGAEAPRDAPRDAPRLSRADSTDSQRPFGAVGSDQSVPFGQASSDQSTASSMGTGVALQQEELAGELRDLERNLEEKKKQVLAELERVAAGGAPSALREVMDAARVLELDAEVVERARQSAAEYEERKAQALLEQEKAEEEAEALNEEEEQKERELLAQLQAQHARLLTASSREEPGEARVARISSSSEGTFYSATTECEHSTAASRCNSQPPTGAEGAGAALHSDTEGVFKAVASEPSRGPPLRKGSAPGKAPPPKRGGPAPGRKAPTSNLLTLRWKESNRPEDVSGAGGDHLKKLAAVGPFASEAKPANVPELPLLKVPERPTTIFQPLAEVRDPPRQLLERYFPRSQRPAKISNEEVPQAQEEAKETTSLLHKTQLQMLEIMVQKFLMVHKGGLQTPVDTLSEAPARIAREKAIHGIKRGVLQCNYSVVRLEVLSVIRMVLKQDDKDGAVCALVKHVDQKGEAALDTLKCPEMHRLVFELSKIPQIYERLECMILQVSYEESLARCRNDLDIVYQALRLLDTKRDTIRRFFTTTHRMGQFLNQKSGSLQAPRGFQLSTLEKLAQTKSTKFPKLTILHFVLAMMSSEDCEALFDASDVEVLRKAKALKTDKVIQDARELREGLYAVRCIFGDDGQYKSVKIERRRKSMPCSSSKPQEGEVDSDDRFHDVMRAFVNSHIEEAEDTCARAYDLILLYKELALFFDDLKSVYPPPKNDQSEKKDLLDIFYHFAKASVATTIEVESEQLRDYIRNNRPDDDTCLASPMF